MVSLGRVFPWVPNFLLFAIITSPIIHHVHPSPPPQKKILGISNVSIQTVLLVFEISNFKQFLVL